MLQLFLRSILVRLILVDAAVASITVLIVRHGQTNENKHGILQGHLDTKLSLYGAKQASQLAIFLCNESFARAYSSDLKRAIGTTETILKLSRNPPEIVQDRRLREKSYGMLEGKRNVELYREANKAGLAVSHFVPIGGESSESLQIRIRSFLKDLERLSDESKDEKILVITHSVWIKAFLKMLVNKRSHLDVQTVLLDNNLKKKIQRKVPGNCSVTTIKIFSSTESSTLTPKDNIEQKHSKRRIEIESVYESRHLKSKLNEQESCKRLKPISDEL